MSQDLFSIQYFQVLDKTLDKVFVNHLDYIKNEVLAKDIVIKKEVKKGENIVFDQIKTFVELCKVKTK